MDEMKIKVNASGPYIVNGPIEITDATGGVHHVPEGVGVALCRCGASTEKPFCTGSHRGVFTDESPITRTFG